jgi:ribosomal protein S18 acetylase RimI-like enzyme
MARPTQSGEVSRSPGLRPLTAKDFEAVVELDRGIIGRSRRGYMEKRLQAALRHPDAHIQLAVEVGGNLAGYLLARIAEGEFGRSDACVVLEEIGIGPAQQRQGVGRKMLNGLEEVMRRKGLNELVTQAEWTNQPLLGFLGATGFSLAPRQILECPTSLASEL